MLGLVAASVPVEGRECWFCGTDNLSGFSTTAVRGHFLSIKPVSVCFTGDSGKVTTVVATPGQGPDRPQEVSYTDIKVSENMKSKPNRPIFRSVHMSHLRLKLRHLHLRIPDI